MGAGTDRRPAAAMHETSPHLTPRPGVLPPFQRVLAACFLEDGGDVAVRAARLPLAPGARLVLLHVVHPWPPWRPVPARAAADALLQLGRDARAAALAAGNPAPEIVPRLAEGWPAAEIVRAAHATESEIVVTGAPATRIDGSARGTLARVLRRARLPLLVVRDDPWSEHGNVLCAVDGSAASLETVALALRLTRAAEPRRLTLFHSYHVPFEEWGGGADAELREEAVVRVRATARALADVAGARTVVRRGDFSTEILRAAHELDPQLVVVGTRCASGLERSIAGSGAGWLIENARWDLAVAPLPAPREP